MKSQRFDRTIARAVLKQLGPTFYTKDLSSHPEMLAAHPELANNPQYHSLMGRWLASDCDDVEPSGCKHTRRGVLWRNRLSRVDRSVPPVAIASPTVASEVTASYDLGPQYAGDDAFAVRMRRHMSWYRASVLRVPCGTGPSESSTNHYGNMLTRADAERGLNFLSPEIHQVALARLRRGGGLVEPYRLLHNMLSSQPMCFNLFGPLVRGSALATTLLQTLPELQVARVLDVKLEFAPEPRDEYLRDSTAFDAFIEYERSDGSRAFLGIETKLTDKFSRKHPDTPSYRRWMRGAGSPFLPQAASEVSREIHNQLWRDHLLAIAMRDHVRSPYQHGTCVLVRHPEDRACEAIVQSYKQLLVPGDTTFIDLPMDRLLSRWEGAALDESSRAWLRAFRQRYLSLHESETAPFAQREHS